MKSIREYPSQEYIKSILDYRDGGLYWKILVKSNMPIGSRAGTEISQGYRCITINKIRYCEHRIIWIWHNGRIDSGLVIDHIDRDKSNNLIENLRILTNSQNLHNRDNSNISILTEEPHWKNYMGRVIIDGKLLRKSFHTESEAKLWVADIKNNYLQSIDNEK